MTNWQIVFLMVIATTFCLPAIIALVISQFHQRTADMIFGWYGGAFGDLCFSNNARAIAFFILAILITISAFIGGFGKPLLDDSVTSVTTSVKNLELKKLPMPKEGSLFWRILTRDGEIKITPPPQVEKTEPAKVSVVSQSRKYASWWWWLAVPTSWLVAIVYFPLSRRDEVFQIFSDWWNKYSTAKAEATIVGDQPTSTNTVKSTIDTVGASVKSKSGGYSPLKDLAMNMLNSLIMEKLFGKKRVS